MSLHNSIRVFKFGGSSIQDASHIQKVASIIKSHLTDQLIIVVSAMGKTTNALEVLVDFYLKGKREEASRQLAHIKQQHYDIVEQLFEDSRSLVDTLNDILVEVEWMLDDEPEEDEDYVYDQIVGLGELLSTRIVHAYLDHIGLAIKWVDARDLIVTDDNYREGWVQWPQTIQRIKSICETTLEQGQHVLTQGFIGSNNENHTVTLGREGSDYTAAIISYCLDAKDMTIWKDVPGVLTADPRVFANTEKLDRLSYREAIEMTYYGAKVIHQKTIKPLQNKSIPLFVKSYIEPEGAGTLINNDIDAHYPPLVTIEKNQALLHVATRDFSFVAEHHLSVLFGHIADLRLQVNMMQNTAISFAVCLNDYADRVDEFMDRIKDEFSIVIDRDLELVTIRHATSVVLKELKANKRVLLEMRIGDTVQFVAKEIVTLKRK